ncbi:MAG: prenyltransferase [Deltaproteobacteria bacterium]|nr:MAG: prenyltransferase [Deltaproteobacteria bacterium]
MRETVERWARFLAAYIPDDYLPVAIGIAMAWRPGVDPDFWRRGVLFVTGAAALSLFIHGSDNIAGYLHGVDRLASATKRSVKEPKLLVTGEVSLGPARVVTAAMLALSLAIGAYLAVGVPWSVIAVGLLIVALAAQYSVGLSLSYRGLGELVVALSGLGAWVGSGVVTRRLEVAPALVGAMLGLFFASVNACSNQADYAFDRASGRGTLAVRLGPRHHRRVAVAILAGGWCTLVAAVAVRAVPLMTGTMLALVPLHRRQLVALFRGDPLEARRIGFVALRLIFIWVAASVVCDRAWRAA